MKRLTHLAFPVMVLLLLFIFPPIMGISSDAQAEESIALSSGAETENIPEETDNISPADSETTLEETDGSDPASPSDTETASIVPDVSDNVISTEPAAIQDIPDALEDAAAETALLSNGSDELYVTRVLAAGSDEVFTAELRHAREEVLSILASDSLKQYSSAAVKLNNGTRYFLPVTYDLSQLDGASPGYFLLHGTIEPLDGILIAPELAHVTLPLFLYDDNSPCEIPAASFYDLNDPMVVIPAGISYDEAAGYLYRNNKCSILLEDGILWEIPLTWDWSSVDLDIPGTYQAAGIPVIPDGILLPESIPAPSCTIVVQDTSLLTLSPPIFSGYYFTVNWTKNTPDKDLLRMYYAIGSGEWVEQAGHDLMHLDTILTQSFKVLYYPEYIDDNFMVFDIPYYFRIEYNGEYSDVLKVFITEDLYNYELIGGDRDGGDRNDQTPPSVTQQPPKTSPSEETPGPAAESESPTNPESWSTQVPPPAGLLESELESDTQNAATWSGTRIKNYISASPGLPLVFEKHRIRAALPADCPVFLNISDTDRLHVEIQPLSADTVRLIISLNDIPLAELPLTVTMPWTGDITGKDLQVKNAAGELIADANYLSRENSVTFTVDRPGIYTIVPAAPEDTGVPAAPPVTPAIVQTTAQTAAPAAAQTAAPAAAQTAALAAAQTAALAAAPAASHGLTAAPPASSDEAAKSTLTVTMSIPAILILGGISIFTFRNHRGKKEED